jgi:hypothetical protein
MVSEGSTPLRAKGTVYPSRSASVRPNSSYVEIGEPFASLFGRCAGVDGGMCLHLMALIQHLASRLAPQPSSPMSLSHRLRRLRVRGTHTTRMRAHHGTVGRYGVL